MSNSEISENLVLITGASSGIGKATALLLNSKGIKVIGVARREEKLKEVKRECKNPDLFFYEIKDIGKNPENSPEFIKDIVDKYGKIGGFVHAAGVLNPEPLSLLEYKNIISDFNTNLFSALMMTKELCRKKNHLKNLSIVYVSSITAKIGNPGSMTYSMTKSALNSVVITLAQELGSQKIHINSVMPGGLNTELARKFNDFVEYDYLKKVREKNVFKEDGKTEYVADLIEFLLSEKSYWIQGQNIIIDGGETLS